MKIKSSLIRTWLAGVCLLQLFCGNQTVHAQTSPLLTPPLPPAGTIHKVDDVLKLAKVKISLDVKDVDFTELLDDVDAATPGFKQIIVRHALLGQHITLSVKDMPFEDVMRATAGFAHCNLYILPDKFLIAPPEQVKPEELKAALKD